MPTAGPESVRRLAAAFFLQWRRRRQALEGELQHPSLSQKHCLVLAAVGQPSAVALCSTQQSTPPPFTKRKKPHLELAALQPRHALHHALHYVPLQYRMAVQAVVCVRGITAVQVSGAVQARARLSGLEVLLPVERAIQPEALALMRANRSHLLPLSLSRTRLDPYPNHPG